MVLQIETASCIDSKGKICRSSKLSKGTWVADVPARGRNARLREAGRSWLRGPPASLQTPLTWWPGEKRLLERAWDGPAISSAHAQSTQVTRSVTSSLGERRLWIWFQAQFIGNSWEHQPSRQDEVVCLLTAASVPGHQSQVLPSSAVFLINEGLCSWILFFKTKY